MNLTDDEFDRLLACRTEEEWNRMCDSIKAVRDGGYPTDWWPRVVKSGMMSRVSRTWAR